MRLDYLFRQSQHGHLCRNLDNTFCCLPWIDFCSCSRGVSMSLISTNVLSMLYKSLPFIYHLHFTSSSDANEFKRFSCSLQHQYSNYSNSNTSRTPVEPSKVPLGTSTTTSAIKIGEVTFFFLGLRPDHPPSNPWCRILVPPPPWNCPRESVLVLRLRA